MGGEFDGGANGANDELGQHSSLHPLARHIAHHNRHVAVFRVGKNLEEVAADFAGGVVLTLDSGSLGWGQVLGNEVLLDIASRPHLAGKALFVALGAREAEDQNVEDGQ